MAGSFSYKQSTNCGVIKYVLSRCFTCAYNFLKLSMMQNICANKQDLHQSTAASTWWRGPRPHLGWVKMVVGLPKGPSYPGHSPSIFCYAAPLIDHRRAAHSFLKIGGLFSLFSRPSLALLRLHILLLLLMSGNVHPNPSPIFP